MSNSSIELFSKLNTSGFIERGNRPIIIADNIRTPENMGSILRLAGNIGAEHTYFIADPTQRFKNHKITRTASGASTKVDWKIIQKQDLQNVIPDTYEIVALETSSDSININTFKFPEKTIFIVGNEVVGISDEVLSMAHHKIHIPIPGPISSLNVTHALSVALFEWLRQIV